MPQDVFLASLIDNDADLFFLEKFVLFVEHGLHNLFFDFEYLNPGVTPGNTKDGFGDL